MGGYIVYGRQRRGGLQPINDQAQLRATTGPPKPPNRYMQALISSLRPPNLMPTVEGSRFGRRSPSRLCNTIDLSVARGRCGCCPHRLIFGDIQGKLDMLRVECTRCERCHSL